MNLQLGRFLHRKADWRKFQHQLSAHSSTLERDLYLLDPEGARERFNNSFVEAGTGSMTRSSGRAISSFWWSPELTALKTSVNRARCALGRGRDPEVMERLAA